MRLKLMRKWTSLEGLLLHMSNVLVLEERPIHIDEVGYDTNRPLHLAAMWADVEAIDMLVTAGAEVDVRGEFNFTALYCAVAFGHLGAAGRLLELGAAPHAEGDWGGSPVDRARRGDVPERIALLEKFGA